MQEGKPSMDVGLIRACAGLIQEHRSALTCSLEEYLRELPARLADIDAKYAQVLSEESPAALRRQFVQGSEELYSGKAVNKTVTEALEFVLEAGAQAIDQLATLATWVNLQVPQCETGNNFGVEVQELVLKSITQWKTGITDALGSLPEYHKTRAESLVRFGKESWDETDTSTFNESTQTKNAEGEKTENKSNEKTNTKKYLKNLAPNEDWVAHTIEIDVQWYFKLKRMLNSIRTGHLSVADVVVKNMDKLLNPRDNSSRSGQDRGGMMMF